MAILLFIVHLLSAVFLLLFSIHVLRGGINSGWRDKIQQSFSTGTATRSALARGAVMGFSMQGATAVVLLLSSLAGAGTVSLAVASIAALGAELGSAIAVQLLALPLSDVGPFAILLGGILFLRTTKPGLRDIGQVILAIGLILLSLGLIRAAVTPVTHIDGIEYLFGYLNTDNLTAALFGLVLTLLMSSSIAAILTILTIATTVGLTPVAGIAFVIGCNLGSAILPIWMTLGDRPAARTIPLTVFSLRCAACVTVLAVLSVAPVSITFSPETAILAGHIGFNAGLMLLAPLCRIIAPAIEQGLRTQAVPVSKNHDDADLAPALVKRELTAILEAVSALTEADSHNTDHHTDRVTQGLHKIQDLFAHAPITAPDTVEDLRQLVSYAIRLERCVAPLAGNDPTDHPPLDAKYQNDIDWLTDAVRRSAVIAQDVVWTQNAETAQRLVAQKEAVSAFENRCRNAYLEAVQGGLGQGQKGSHRYLQHIATLKEVNSKVATIGYAVLDKQGGLKKSRLRSHLKVIEV